MVRSLRRHATKIRLALGLTSITVTFMLLASFLPIFPDFEQLNTQAQIKVARVVAANGTLLVSQNDVRRMQAVLTNIIESDTDVKRAEVVEGDETVVAVGEDKVLPNWHKITAPIWQGETQWGEVNLYFPRLYPAGLTAFYHQPLVRFILFVSLLSMLAFTFYLGRMLKMLDPSQAIPDRVRSALDTMAEGLLVLDSKQNIVLANQAFAEIVGVRQVELIGVNGLSFNWLNVGGETFSPNDAPWVRAIKKSQAVMAERIRLRLKNGYTHTFMVNCSPVLRESGKAGGVLVSFDDVTLLEKQELELIRSKEEAEIANQTKSDFLANMSHEIRTPMNAIIGFTEVLRRGYGSGEKNIHYLETIAKNSKHLLELINDILDLSKVESGQIEVESIPSKVHHVISDIVDVLNLTAQKKAVLLIYDPQQPIPEEVLTDPGRIRQILTNLIGNAIKFTQQGKVTVRTHWQNNTLRVDVVDTGIGMSETQLANVFDPFVQADSSITRRFGGTGLGLTISKRYANALGGDIRVKSKLGKGSVFSLTIAAPAVADAAMIAVEDQRANRKPMVTLNETWRFSGANIMVVDDSEENRDLIELLLQSHGLNVSKFENAVDAIESAIKQPPDVILMDVQMPVMDGYTAVAQLRKQGVTLPIFALTAHAMKGIEEKCKNAGFSGYIGKPINIEDLLSTLAQTVEGKRVPVVDADLDQNDQYGRNDDGWKPGTPIYSSYHGNEKYSQIITRFVAKLDVELKELASLHARRDYENLTMLAHKLKGSAGTVGFYAFTAPFNRLEISAQDKDDKRIVKQLELLNHMLKAIDVLPVHTNESQEVPRLTDQKIAR